MQFLLIHETQKSSHELDMKCWYIGIALEFGVFVFVEGGKPTTNSTHV